MPRSGTSLMMQLLEAGGIPVFTDQMRKADESNKKGYYEHERIKYLKTDIGILNQVKQRCVKIVAPLLFDLPANFRYKIIFMERSLNEILLSQHKMRKQQNTNGSGATFSLEMMTDYGLSLIHI